MDELPLVARPPRTPSPARRESLGPDDVFVSPVAWNRSPTYKRDRDAIERLTAKGDVLCRGKIGHAYIQEAIRDPTTAFWLVRDANGRIFGFALTKSTRNRLELKLLCTHKRKGEGMRLFRDILLYAASLHKVVTLEPLEQVEDMYKEVGTNLGFRIEVFPGKPLNTLHLHPPPGRRGRRARNELGAMLEAQRSVPGPEAAEEAVLPRDLAPYFSDEVPPAPAQPKRAAPAVTVYHNAEEGSSPSPLSPSYFAKSTSAMSPVEGVPYDFSEYDLQFMEKV